MKRDNSTFQLKVSMRRNLLSEIDAPIVIETHGGYGRLWSACYTHLLDGVVFEKDRAKVEVLARQRPTWAVYEADCVRALAEGAGSHLMVNLYDVDPWGDPWSTLEALFSSKRPRPERLCVAVTDGLRDSARAGHGWAARSLRWAVQRYGNTALYPRYREICFEMFSRLVGSAGYDLRKWMSCYAGHHERMTHYAAVLEKAS